MPGLVRVRDAGVLALLLATSALAWLVTHRLAMPDMRLGVLTRAGSVDAMDSMDAGSTSTAVSGALFLAVWVVMMVAMMFPPLAPVVSTFDRWRRRTRRAASLTFAFVLGYLLVWTSIGLLAYAFVLALDGWLPFSERTAIRSAGILVVAAGVYQFSPLKRMCLRFCRSPLGFFAQYAGELRRGHKGPFRVGIAHGMYCVGCCWFLMVVLVLLGMMNVVWMGLVAALIFVEKVVRHGPVIGRLAGSALAVAGAAIAVSPALVA